MSLNDQLALLSLLLPFVTFEKWKTLSRVLGEEQHLKSAIIYALSEDESQRAIELLGSARWERLKEIVEGRSIRVCYPGLAEYPLKFNALEASTPIFTYIGEPVWLSEKGLGVVGSREPHPANIKWMDVEFHKFLLESKLSVISGGARGIDQKAHTLSLLSSRPTICFQPSGLLNPYPDTPSLRELAQEIVKNKGAIVSVFAPDEPMRKSHFAIRNYYLAAMSEILLVVQAGRKSGTMLTAKYAQDLGVPICTLPQSPMDQSSLGNLDLIVSGAEPLRDAMDLKVFFGPLENTGPCVRLREFQGRLL